MDRINVLVYPSGAENALEVHQALKGVMNVRLFGASSRDDHGAFVFREHTTDAPAITDRDFVERFNALLESWGIQVVIPTHDDVSLHLAEVADRLKARVAVPGVEQARTCRSKRATYALLEGLPCVPRTYSGTVPDDAFPVFVKPDRGQGGKGAFRAEGPQDLQGITPDDDVVICEFLPGTELTVDAFTDRHGRLRFVGARSRDRVFGGVSARSTTVPLSDEVRIILEEVNALLRPRGLWYVQLRQDAQGAYKLMEVSVRAAGTMNLYRVLGVNFPLLTVYDLLDMDVEVLANDMYLQVDRALFNRYRTQLEFDTVYIDYDDTVTRTLTGTVDPLTMSFLYHMRDRGKRIVLITKHRNDLTADMERHRIHVGLFDEVHHLAGEERKSDLVRPGRAVFIDNSFAERKEVKERHNIPVFDVDGIAALMDWRE
ncbi:MAG: ATP-grasp domain-containing protein [Flavobacteriales bacterium]|nr:ATP-grasp domain-containing protein [Flavobacteriales bacterium]MCB9193638.1 ATP-grasp domain-containing protein [Flavobacteriales bacterium]